MWMYIPKVDTSFVFLVKILQDKVSKLIDIHSLHKGIFKGPPSFISHDLIKYQKEENTQKDPRHKPAQKHG